MGEYHKGYMPFKTLKLFIDSQMQMSHVYQPVMMMTLLKNGGACTEEQIARALLSYDASQIEYYEKITRDMVGRVLRNREIVTRDRKTKTYHLSGAESLSDSEVRALVGTCKEKLDEFLASRGDSPWSHRKKSAGYISGTIRYEILKAAKSRCELCGTPADVKALEVDHIVPRNAGGTDDLSNLQALCYSCNAMKRDRDDTDFREVRASYDNREKGCVFCEIPESRVIAENELAYAIRDDFPVTEGHSLIITRRHVSSVFELGRPETNACLTLLSEIRAGLQSEHPEISGFNVGINDGEDSGQTIFHCHWHLIPRRAGDVPDPRGGVRNTISGKGGY
jgi:diadenosine tetraphosphate (Ap4A) HIT family hydrolase/5-methylcytosine-specific restriction endonuclease McrA